MTPRYSAVLVIKKARDIPTAVRGDTERTWRRIFIVFQFHTLNLLGWRGWLRAEVAARSLVWSLINIKSLNYIKLHC